MLLSSLWDSVLEQATLELSLERWAGFQVTPLYFQVRVSRQRISTSSFRTTRDFDGYFQVTRVFMFGAGFSKENVLPSCGL